MAIGITLKAPLSVSTIDGHYKMLTDYPEAVKQNLKMLLLTAPGERIMSPSYGVGLRNYLFELAGSDFRNILYLAISNQIKTHLPYVVVDNILVNDSISTQGIYNTLSDNMVEIVISYNIRTFNNYRDTLTITVNNTN